jgi:hypothetical protein
MEHLARNRPCEGIYSKKSSPTGSVVENRRQRLNFTVTIKVTNRCFHANKKDVHTGSYAVVTKDYTYAGLLL